MQFKIQKPANENINNSMRGLGYFLHDQNYETSELNFIKPLDRSGYPRFHIYLKTEGENIMFNLHLDQKKPIYRGTTAHSGEYDGDLVESEAERIKQNFR